jgi:hypothetical protein
LIKEDKLSLIEKIKYMESDDIKTKDEWNNLQNKENIIFEENIKNIEEINKVNELKNENIKNELIITKNEYNTLNDN